MRSTVSGKNIINHKSTISSNQNITSINKMGTFQTISNDAKFTPSEDLTMFSHLDQYWDRQARKNRSSSYEGDLRAGKKWGLGSYLHDNGDFYHGSWENDKQHGEGILYFDDKNDPDKPVAYTGTFEYGLFHGFGKLFKCISRKEGGWIYQGTWRFGKREGQGKQYYNYDEKTYYEGAWLQDERHGMGKLVFEDSEYDGMWENGKMHGEGRLSMIRNQIKTVFTGNWNNDELTTGKINYFILANGHEIGTYTGDIKDYQRHGRGSYRSGENLYEGIFENDEPVGNGNFAGKNFQQSWAISGNFVTLKDLEAMINYNNKDQYSGRADILANQVYRTNGIYEFSDGGKANGRFEDDESGQIRGQYQFLR